MLIQKQAHKNSGQPPVGNGMKMQNSQQQEPVSPEMLLNCGVEHPIGQQKQRPSHWQRRQLKNIVKNYQFKK